MRPTATALAFAALVLAGCDTIYGVTRDAKVHEVPDLQLVKAQIESYPEIKDVELLRKDGARPLTWHGIEKAEEDFYLSYTDHDLVHGTLMFSRDYEGNVEYAQSLIQLNRPVPQQWIDATWIVMMKIERDLVERFGLAEISANAATHLSNVKDPARKQPVEP
jgi:hypothetical protein